MMVEKVHVKNEWFWKFSLAYLGISLALLALNVGKGPLLPLLNVFLALVFLVLASRFRALKIQCGGETFFLIPDYATHTLLIKGSGGRVLTKDFLPRFGEKELETPCGTLRIETVPHRFGKVELVIKAEGVEVRLP